MTRFYRPILAILAILLLAGAVFVQDPRASAATKEEIEAQIQQRTEKLRQVNVQLAETQKQLNTIQGQKASLQKEVNSLDASVRKLNLDIQSDELTIANLSDEISILQERLTATASLIDDKKSTISATLQELQKKDDTSLILLVLASRSLAEGLSDAQSLGSLRNRLTEEVGQLQDLSADYIATLESLGVKRDTVAVRRENLQNRKEIAEDQKDERAVLLAETRSQESVYQQRVNQLKAEQEKLDQEIARIEAELRAALNPSSVPTAQEGLFSWPVQSVRITQHFGEVSYLYRGKGHNGLDLGASVGTPILAAGPGTVRAVGNNDRSATLKYQYGRYVLIDHSNNLTTLYAHLSRPVVAPGQVVQRGEIIGYSGNTGYATGPHLHFGVYYTPTVSLKSLPPAAGLVPVGATLRPENYLPTY